MNILIMGDSWGESEIEFCFLKRKHLVFNQSVNAGSNIRTLKKSKAFLEYVTDLVKIDLIVWFQTEYSRDIYGFVNDYFGELSAGYYCNLDQIHAVVYQYITDLRQLSLESKWVVIGGHAPVYKPADYLWADLLIKDWKSELLNKELPFCHTIKHSNIMRYKTEYGINVLHKELTKSNLILDAVLARPDIFPDGVHPSDDCHEQLCERIILNIF